ncbi:MAG: DUF4159 domain-containing protein [Polyangiaceae bacterium]
MRFPDGEEATLELEKDGVFRISAADALPTGARTPAQALEELRRVQPRRSYAGLMRVLTPSTRAAIEADRARWSRGWSAPRASKSTLPGTPPRSKFPGARGEAPSGGRRLARGGLRLSADRLARRQLLARRAAAGLGALGSPRPASAFGEEGAFHPRVLLTGNARWEGVRATAPARWAFELEQRTSAPVKRNPGTVRADEGALLAEPFAIWGGEAAAPPLTQREISGLRRFLALGGVLFVDDFAPEARRRRRWPLGAPRDRARAPGGSPIPIGTENVVFRSFYLLKRAVGRIDGPPKLDAIVRAGNVQVIFSAHDLCGALARSPNGIQPVAVTPGGELQRERAVRMAVNIAMYVLCSNYKDDQVHAPFLMRRRAADAP